MRLTQHFTLSEFTKSGTATRRGIDNTPPRSFLPKLIALAEVLEVIRLHFGGKPVRINSGFRCHLLNEAIGGAVYSEHRMGCAVDFEIIDAGDPNSGWIHLAIPSPTKQTGRIG